MPFKSLRAIAAQHQDNMGAKRFTASLGPWVSLHWLPPRRIPLPGKGNARTFDILPPMSLPLDANGLFPRRSAFDLGLVLFVAVFIAALWRNKG